MESIDPSIERRRREYIGSGVPLSTLPAQDSSDFMTLSAFFRLMVEKKIDGPHLQMDIHLGGKHLGSGAQFDVYGHQHAADRSFPSFDQPYASTGLKPSISITRSRPVVVAIKRPVFKVSFGDYRLLDPESSTSMGFGTPSQLRALELEIRALCEDSIRSHRNIVKLLAWGLEQEGTDQTKGGPLSPFLVLEHGNSSLSNFLANDNGTIPWQVLQRLALDVAQGLSVLHASSIIHGDLKTDNVLVFPDQEGPFFCVAKLSDFGLAVLDQKEKIFNTGTPGWQAPELPSDEGIGTELLMKCDHFSLGLVIFSTILMNGAPPLRGSKSTLALELARASLTLSNIPRPTSDRISSALECLLQSHPADRDSDLEKVCNLLTHIDNETFDSQGDWVDGRFDDNTAWGELLISLYGNTMILGTCSKRPQYMTQGIIDPDVISYSWLEIHKFLCELMPNDYAHIASYYINSIDRIINQRTYTENLSMDIVGQEITGYQLLGLCFNDRLALLENDQDHKDNSPRVARRLRASCAAVAAIKGYFPAQAVALKLLEDTGSKLLERVLSNDTKWQWNAVSTGYNLAWKFAQENPEEHVSALDHFRKSGGYNSHYICTLSKVNLAHDTSGLFRSLTWLTAYPLHHAAVHGDVHGIERLLENYHIDSTDDTGETALQRACMAGASSSVRCLMKHGADPTVKSKNLGTVPLHWLFVFEPNDIHDTAILLTSKDKSVLGEFSSPNTEAFHYPFKWPVGTPLEWAVLSNRSTAVETLISLGSTVDLITDFFPGPPDWTKQIYGIDTRAYEAWDDPGRKLWSFWIYHAMEQYRLPVIRSSISYQKQLEHLSSNRGQRARKRNLHIFNTYGRGLNTAVVENDFDAVKQLIDMGADVNHIIKDRSGNPSTPLMTAVVGQNPDIVQLLLANGARFDGRDCPNSPTPLQLAARQKSLKTVKILLDRDAEVNAQAGGDCGTALFEAAKAGHSATVNLLLKYGADPLIENGYRNALEVAAFMNNCEIVELLLENGANPNTPGKLNPHSKVGNALNQAAFHGNLKNLRALLDKGGDPNIRGGDYETTLQAAINPPSHQMWGQQTAVVQLLLERGVDVTVSGGKYGSIMQAAACSGDHGLAKLILDAGAPLDIGGGPHGSALQAAVSSTEGLALVQLLLDHGADPDFGGEEQWSTPLQVAVHRGNERQVELLLRRGADPNNNGGLHGNALKMAEMSGNTRIRQMLLDWGARDESEPDWWDPVLDRVSAPSVSLSDISNVRFLLARCFERPRKTLLGVLSSSELVDKIIDLAEYWLVELSQRHEALEVSGNTQDTHYLQVPIKSWPSPDTKVLRVVFRIKSRDTKIIKMPELHRDDPFYNSNTWFEAGLTSSNDSKAPSHARLIIQKNFSGSLTTRTHNITWDLDGKNLEISRFLSSLNPGDVLDVYARAGGDESINFVDSIDVIVFYGRRIHSIPQSPTTEIREKEPEVTQIQPPSLVSETPEKPPTKTTTDKTKEPGVARKRIGFFGKVAGYCTCCFK